ncbi:MULTISPECIES: hypothetical protein [Hyphomonas]|uniref:Uncharacterized protein n=1 Tax=Hyphomonas adhaerens TaxID=81029 RepID=A0A3B9H393_9PROT|nr:MULTISPECIES: hypothetical protein [Hyphomonas]MBB41226.1 hypothetical protein [Hyphomonas sp.]HAE29137.1 hypothetical protein [Hyphomonas adhaerens]|tara:strand:+ start:3596 stop:4819 length:1224 start_codon:yes stop_codon:yes gene_type:complete
MTKTHFATRVAVTIVFALLYLAFLTETGVLVQEFGASGLALRLASLDSQNFIFFPVAGLLALVAFWQPAVLLVDAMWRGQLKFGRIVLGGSLVVALIGAWLISGAFESSEARSVFEISPKALAADDGAPATADAPPLAPVTEVLTRMRILSGVDRGLGEYQAQCDREWLQYSVAAEVEMLCFPSGERLSVRACCTAKAAFRQHLNRLAAEAPSRTGAVHRWVMPVKIFFLLLLLGIGILLVQYRKGLERLHGMTPSGISFGLALGGAVMLIWPLLNAAYLQTMALLTGSGSASAYTIVAPLIALGFGVWTLLLVFFHLRSYPSQIEYAAKVGGFIAAAIGVFRYEEITNYLARTLGVGGGLVAIIVFAVGVGALIISVILGVDPTDIKLDEDLEDAVKTVAETASGD